VRRVAFLSLSDPTGWVIDDELAVLPLARRGIQVDTIPWNKPGVDWGAEVPFGTGQVNVAQFLRTLKEIGYSGPLAIEREAGDDRLGDVAKGVEALKAQRAP